MFGQPIIILSKPIISARILQSRPAPSESEHQLNGCGTELNSHTQISSDLDENAPLNRFEENQKGRFSQACRILKEIADKLNNSYENVLMKHKEEIAGLSIAIARKILVQKVEEGDYKIETIVAEALKNIPTQQDVEVYLNPKDLEQCQKAIQEEKDFTLTGIKFVPDQNIGQAECVVKSPKGIIHSFINEHLDQIGEALKKA